MTELLKRNTPFVWSEKTDEAFITLKDILTSEPLLQFPDFMKSFILTTDASNEAVDAILRQGPIGRDLSISYASRTLVNSERSYSVTEKELVEIAWGCKQF